MHDEPLPRIMADSLALLELPGVLEEVSSHALSEPGKDRVLASSPDHDPDLIRTHLNLVAELKEMIGLHGALGMHALIPMEGLFARLENPGTVLDAEEILVIADLLALAGRTQDRLNDLEERFVLLRAGADSLVRLSALKHRIAGVLDERGAVKPSASPRLAEIHERARAGRERILKRLDKIVNDQDLARIVQEDYVTLRNDRYVILLRPEFKGLLDGIIHDHSRSGASVYVEPFSVVEMNNQVAGISDEEREEIRRIFKELTGEIRASMDAVRENYDALAELDSEQARALYALATSSIVPELVDNGFRILGGRHPLLLAAGTDSVVPMDVVQVDATRTTVISGANMGGKTVALKIAGLFPLMVRTGIMVPAREGTKIQPFARIMADIGEDQDIRSRISSFSGHMLRIKAVIDDVRPGDLVLLDELGGATDPEEGAALAMAILDELAEQGARVLVTTHLTHLKAYGLSRPHVKNVSVEFHPVTLKPTFRLLYDLPGESHAIETAERIGLAPHVIAAARKYGDAAAGGSSSLLQRLREKMSEVETERQGLEETQQALDRELAEIRANRENEVEEFRIQMREFLRKAERQIADLQQSLKSGRLKAGAKPREVLREIKEEVVQTLGVPLEKTVPLPLVGATVRVKALGREGTVKSIPERGKVEVAVGGLTMRVDAEDLDIVRVPATNKKSSSKTEQIGVGIPIAAPRWELNVIGLRVDEALPMVEKVLDEALLGGLSTVNIIHGKGTGRLKKGIREYLSGHALVSKFHPGAIEAGGDGVTVVELIEE